MNVLSAMTPSAPVLAWLDRPHCELPITVPLYVAGIYASDLEAIVTIYRDGSTFAVGEMEIEGARLNGHPEHDSRCVPVEDAAGKRVTTRVIVRQAGSLIYQSEPTLAGFIADQIIRELDTRYHTQRAEEALHVAERDWRA